MNRQFFLPFLFLTALPSGHASESGKGLYPAPIFFDKDLESSQFFSCFPGMGLIENVTQYYFQGLLDENNYLDQVCNVLNDSDYACTKNLNSFFSDVYVWLLQFKKFYGIEECSGTVQEIKQCRGLT